ncbi:alanine aminotransferase 1-like [Leucoraja erinacea]|uniref:alanine aminotransferase 1-like n=1 Tax=Leucoraja erinaceus TaxID=7782 RepID=UPI002454E222|nr:alanine aminotransferase 1-like [Leucoraja erinacea]
MLLRRPKLHLLPDLLPSWAQCRGVFHLGKAGSASELRAARGTWQWREFAVFLRPEVQHTPFTARLLQKGAVMRQERQQSLGWRSPVPEVMGILLGDVQGAGQQPITFLRQVTAISTYPRLLDHPALPLDAKQRAREILANCAGNSIGAYTEPEGIGAVRHSVAQYLEQRDGGVPADPNNVYLMNGTSNAMSIIFNLLIDRSRSRRTGLLVPVPCGEVSWHTISMLGGVVLPYHLDAEQGWEVTAQELRRVVEEGRGHCQPMALCVTNPGIPTGHVMSRRCMEHVIRFAVDEGLLILAKEGHPSDIYSGSCQQQTFKKVLSEMGPKYAGVLELVSFNSVSSGHIGESGARGCFMEVLNMSPAVQMYIGLMLAAFDSASVTAQIAIDVATRPPQPGHPSYPLFQAEKRESLRMLAEQARLTEGMLNTIPGISCAVINSGTFAFPRIELPDGAREAAEAMNLRLDTFYSHRLLMDTGCLLAPGGDFGLQDGPWHFRMNFLLPLDKLKLTLEKIMEFHRKFMAEFS